MWTWHVIISIAYHEQNYQMAATKHKHKHRPGTGASSGPGSRNHRNSPKTSGTSERLSKLTPFGYWILPGIKGSKSMGALFVWPRWGGTFLLLQPVRLITRLAWPPDNKQALSQPTCHALSTCLKQCTEVPAAWWFLINSGLCLYWLRIKATEHAAVVCGCSHSHHQSPHSH